jgi:hypothetical protein
MSKSLFMTNNFPFVPGAKIPDYFQGFAEPGRIVHKNNLRFPSVFFQAGEAAARDSRGIVNCYNDGHGGACLNVFRRLHELYVAREESG